MYPVILASASPRRSELLRQIGIQFHVQASQKEEIASTTVPGELVMQLSRDKAGDIAGLQKEPCMVIGADTVVAMDHEILGKPKDEQDARRMLGRISGKTHQVYTGVTVIVWDGAKIIRQSSFYEMTNVTITELSEEEISSYIESKEPMDKAGAYGIQGRFACFVKKIDGDYYTVVGLPLAHLYKVIKELNE